MDYQACVQQCISILQAAGDEAEADIASYRAFPIPSAAEWADVLKTTASDGGATPFACMMEYEVLLNKRGFQTPDGLFVNNFREIALDAGAPPERVPDLLTLFLLMRATDNAPRRHDLDRRRVH
jgi:hypothetical protein